MSSPSRASERASERVQQILSDAAVVETHGGTLTEALCADCARLLPVIGVGLALMSSRGPEGLIAATDGPATTMEELQFGLGEGPCVDASTRGRPVLQPHLRRTAPAPWPGFGPAALESGIEAIFAFPLQVGGIRLRVQDREPTDGELHPDLADLADNLAEVHQATGMVAVQAAVGLAEALLMLRARAFSSERALLEVALDVIGNRLRFPSNEGHHE